VTDFDIKIVHVLVELSLIKSHSYFLPSRGLHEVSVQFRGISGIIQLISSEFGTSHKVNLILIRIGSILHEADIEFLRFSQKHFT
jgi:hypothetical protein